MDRQITQVSDFHSKIGAPQGEDLRLLNEDGTETKVSEYLIFLAADLETMDEDITKIMAVMKKEKCKRDSRLMRMHLIMSELAELSRALSERDEAETLDALTDIAYVTIGSAVNWGLPLHKAFEEVHRANMSKDPTGDRHHEGVSGKGSTYVAPDIKTIIAHKHAQDKARN